MINTVPLHRSRITPRRVRTPSTEDGGTGLDFRAGCGIGGGQVSYVAVQ